MKITREDVIRVADLAYLELSESELETYRAQIDEILEYIGKLNELDTTNVAPMTQVLTGDQTADATLRDDIHVRSTVAADVLKHALPAKKLSASELAADFFTRIDAQNPALNAYLTLSPERAYAQADKIDALIASNKPLPPLAGVPVAIKDVLSTRGIRTTCGS